MAGVRRFEDFVAWQKAHELAVAIYRTTGDRPLARDFGLRDQMRRAAVSVSANVAEGFERRRPADFYRLLEIAGASCAEVRSHLYIARDVFPTHQLGLEELIGRTGEVSRVLTGLMVTVAAARDRFPGDATQATGNQEPGTPP